MSMIAQLRGTLVEKGIERVVIDVGGVGYAAQVTLHTLAELPEAGREVTLRTHLQIREDAHVLYGFATEAERRAFELCITVSGIGPKLALALLSTLRPETLAQAIRAGDVARLGKTPGVGKRTAERLVVELKDRVDRLGVAPGGARVAEGGRAGTALPDTEATVASALVNLGYRGDAAERAAKEAHAQHAGQPIEVVLKEALRALTQ